MSSKPVVFPYGITLKEEGDIDTVPVVEARFESARNEHISFFLLLDSGAALSALPKSDASFLNIEVECGLPMHISGISGKPIKGWRHTVSMRLAGESFSLPVVFLESDDSPRVLGRAGVFERFTIIFEEHKNRSIFLNAKSTEAQGLQEFLKTR